MKKRTLWERIKGYSNGQKRFSAPLWIWAEYRRSMDSWFDFLCDWFEIERLET